MSETTAVYRDDYQAVFTGEETFLDFLREREEEAQWRRQQANTLKFVPLEEGSVITGLLKNIFSINGKEKILEDTMAHTGLMLKLDEEFFPIRSCAVKTIMNRARISGNGLTKVSKAELVEILNMCMATAAGDALLRFADEKVSAVHGGDESDYAVLEMPSLFQRTADFLRSHFSRPCFCGGSYEHALATAIWVLEDSDKMTEAYTQTLMAHGQQPEEVDAALWLVSSDVGVSGANLYPMLVCGSESKVIPLGTPIKLEHDHGADLDKFDQKLVTVFGQYEVALEGLARLLDIEIDNPINTMLGVMKRIGITKKLASLAAELYEAQYGARPCTAHDLFYGIAEAPAMLQAPAPPGSHRWRRMLPGPLRSAGRTTICPAHSSGKRMKKTCYIKTELCKSGFWKGAVVFENGSSLLATASAVSEQAAHQAATEAVPGRFRLVEPPKTDVKN